MPIKTTEVFTGTYTAVMVEDGLRGEGELPSRKQRFQDWREIMVSLPEGWDDFHVLLDKVEAQAKKVVKHHRAEVTDLEGKRK